MKLGIERLLEGPASRLAAWGKCALLSNHASVDPGLRPSWALLQRALGPRLTTLYSPQHGFDATVQDNMIESGHGIHKASGLKLYSLYSETREPTPAMLENVDTIVIDIQISGCRVYTFKYTIAACLRAAKAHGKRVVILDRPNPLGGEYLEGRVLDLDAVSFVGEFAIPMRHGLTAGEAGLFFNQSIGAELEVVPLADWNPRDTVFTPHRPWIITSPNLPTIEAAIAYPGTVLFEGTNVSEGRGTSLPFHLIGAPFIESPEAFVERVKELMGALLPEACLRPATFQPTSNKWMGKNCRGCQIVVRPGQPFPGFALGLALLRVSIEQGQGQFAWKEPPYEYDYKTLPIKLIVGSLVADKMLEAKAFSLRDSFWSHGVESYAREAQKLVLYPRELKTLRAL